MIVIIPNTNSIPLSLNQFNEQYNLLDSSNRFDITKWHYVFKITNDLTLSEFVFQPYNSATYSNGGDLYWGTSKSSRMNEFRWIISSTSSNLLNGQICLTGSNWDESQWTYEAWAVWGTPSLSGTPSIANVGLTESNLLESGRLFFTI
jgi:hypothetical protein